jgi:hypothetical protein
MIARMGCPPQIRAGCVFRKRRVAVIGNRHPTAAGVILRYRRLFQ